MSLSLYDIERSVGVDLLRRPLVGSILNAALLRFYVENLYIDPDEDQDDEDEPEAKSILKNERVGMLFAILVVFATYIIQVLSIAESIQWFVMAVIYKLIRAPGIYAFDKLVLDVRALLAKTSVKYVEKKIRLYGIQHRDLPRMRATRQGFGGLVVTTVKIDDALSRDSAALFKLLKYMNAFAISYFADDTLVFVGKQKAVVDALCALGEKPLAIDLGWHIDSVERTTFRIHLKFTRDLPKPTETDVTFIGRRRVTVELDAEASTENLELMAHVMDQFSAVCEAGERGMRMFNGKRFSIYAVGLTICIILIVFYEGLEGLLKPSADVLTLAFGAFTLWMTLGKSAVLGETNEKVNLNIAERKNFLLAYHGLAHVHRGVSNCCWVPEIYRPVTEGKSDLSLGYGMVTAGKSLKTDGEEEGPPSEAGSSIPSMSYIAEDGSISVLEASLCLSIVHHFGHYLKWKSDKLVIDRYVMSEGPMAHIKAVERLDAIQDLESSSMLGKVVRIGGNGRTRRRRAKRRVKKENDDDELV